MTTTTNTTNAPAMIGAGTGIAMLAGVWAAALAMGCTDFAGPAELAQTQILAVRAVPPAIVAGGTSDLEILIAGPDGDVQPDRLRWRVMPGSGGIVSDGGTLRAPANLDKLQLAEVEVVATVAGEELIAVKYVGLGVPAPTSNPVIQSIAVDQRPIAEDRMAIAAGTTIELSAEIAGGTSSDIYLWYATAGDVDDYRESQTRWTAPAQPGGVFLYLVYRDGVGGVDWRRLEITVE